MFLLTEIKAQQHFHFFKIKEITSDQRMKWELTTRKMISTHLRLLDAVAPSPSQERCSVWLQQPTCRNTWFLVIMNISQYVLLSRLWGKSHVCDAGLKILSLFSLDSPLLRSQIWHGILIIIYYLSFLLLNLRMDEDGFRARYYRKAYFVVSNVG